MKHLCKYSFLRYPAALALLSLVACGGPDAAGSAPKEDLGSPQPDKVGQCINGNGVLDNPWQPCPNYAVIGTGGAYSAAIATLYHSVPSWIEQCNSLAAEPPAMEACLDAAYKSEWPLEMILDELVRIQSEVVQIKALVASAVERAWDLNLGEAGKKPVPDAAKANLISTAVTVARSSAQLRTTLVKIRGEFVISRNHASGQIFWPSAMAGFDTAEGALLAFEAAVDEFLMCATSSTATIAATVAADFWMRLPRFGLGGGGLPGGGAGPGGGGPGLAPQGLGGGSLRPLSGSSGSDSPEISEIRAGASSDDLGFDLEGPSWTKEENGSVFRGWRLGWANATPPLGEIWSVRDRTNPFAQPTVKSGTRVWIATDTSDRVPQVVIYDDKVVISGYGLDLHYAQRVGGQGLRYVCKDSENGDQYLEPGEYAACDFLQNVTGSPDQVAQGASVTDSFRIFAFGGNSGQPTAEGKYFHLDLSIRNKLTAPSDPCYSWSPAEGRYVAAPSCSMQGGSMP